MIGGSTACLRIDEIDEMNAINKNIEAIKRSLPEGVQILAAVKTRTLDEARAASDAGIRLFGHNYVQEAEAMITRAEDFDADWHMIGHLQRNKAKQAVEIFDLIESLDSLRLARELEKRCSQAEKEMPVLIEVNSGREKNKTGILPEDIGAIVEYLRSCDYLKLRGLMTMGPLTGDPELSRPYFKETRRIFEEISRTQASNGDVQILSMGMSNSYQIAVDEGANLIRLGTCIFGPRDS